MTDIEIRIQVKAEYEKLAGTTLVRLRAEYKKERIKLRIDPTRTYTKNYLIKTPGKNTWIIFISKPPSSHKYLEDGRTCAVSIVYYYTPTGIRVFRQGSQDETTVFSAHFFQRYNERLKLNIDSTIDVVKHFFTYNNHVYGSKYEIDGKTYAVAFSKDGLLLGLLECNGTWLLWKTFVNKALIRADQNKKEKETLQRLERHMDNPLNDTETGIQRCKVDQDKIFAVSGRTKE